MDSWKIINNDWNRFRNFITLEIVKPSLQQRAQLQLKTPANMTTSKNVTTAAHCDISNKTISIYKA